MKKYLISIVMGCLLLAAAVIAQEAMPPEDTTTVVEAEEAIKDYGPVSLVYTMVLDGAIGVVTDQRIADAIELAEDDDAELLVLLLDTPGGFVNATWSICKNILNSEVPVCMFIAPSGARAGSAGVYMTYASHIAAMAPSTNIGAAHPVGGGEEIDSIMNEKITNDAVAQIKAAAEKRGRNVEWAEQAVRESVSITNNEALELNVIDLIADDLDDLFAQLDGREVELPEETRTLALGNVKTEDIPTTFIHRFLTVITDPNIVFILFSLGGLGIMLELYNPGSILPGVVGAICLILAFYASSTLPINYAGVALILLSIIMFIAEVKVPSAGMLTVGGVISLFLGGLMLIDTVDPTLQVSKSLLVTVVILVGAIAGLVGWMVVKAAKRRPFTGDEGMIGKIAEVRKRGFVYVDGALWQMICDDEVEPGAKVEVIGVDKLILKVRKQTS
ncbi:MAG: nodulation protein NfeD [bacterium]|nr:nodulation protein NfeD [bacterium]